MYVCMHFICHKGGRSKVESLVRRVYRKLDRPIGHNGRRLLSSLCLSHLHPVIIHTYIHTSSSLSQDRWEQQEALVQCTIIIRHPSGENHSQLLTDFPSNTPSIIPIYLSYIHTYIQTYKHTWWTRSSFVRHVFYTCYT